VGDSFFSQKINHVDNLPPFSLSFLDDEIKSAEEKFAESLQHAQMGMYHLLENDVS
jgi:hypothetical protein